METRDITAFMEESETPKTRAFDHALDIEFLILDEMERKNVSKKELAERMGISPQNLSKLLNTQPNMTLETIARFELALDFALDIKVKEPEEIGQAFSASYRSSSRCAGVPVERRDERRSEATLLPGRAGSSKGSRANYALPLRMAA